jgi:hypothetical protein
MITAKQATNIIAENELTDHLQRISNEIENTAKMGMNFTQIVAPPHLQDHIIEILRDNEFDVELGGRRNFINVTWPRP